MPRRKNWLEQCIDKNRNYSTINNGKTQHLLAANYFDQRDNGYGAQRGYTQIGINKQKGSMFKPIYYLTVLTVTLGASTQFYSYGIVNPEQELLTNWINTTYASRQHSSGLTETQLNLFWSLVVSSISIGALVGALSVRTLAEKAGRRNALIINGVVNVFAALLEFGSKWAESPEMLIIGRFIIGANMSITTGLAPMFLMEITPNRYRGAAGTFHQIAVAFSDCLSLFLGLPEILGSETLWPIAFGLPGLPALLLCIVLPLCPESPKFLLVSRGERDKAKQVLNKLVNEDEAKQMFESLIKEAALSQEGLGSFKQLFTKYELRIPIIVSILVMFAQQFTGCGAVFAYSTDMFISAQLTPKAARFSTLAVGIVYFASSCSAPFLIEKLGRRRLSLFQLSMVAVSLSFLSVFSYLQNVSQSSWATSGTIFSLVFYMLVYGVGSPIPWMITSELFETKYRSAAVTFSVFIAWTLSFLISTLYLPFQQSGISFSFLPFIVLTVVFTITIYCILPETQHKPASEVVEEIRFRATSISSGHPFRVIPQSTTNDETQSLLRSESDFSSSHYRYMSTTG
ncbi:MFS transporter, SP family [Aphelenchoides bicaudatus]|nr:MFS transporter, SP family [Aphelenchoides bicaudatus]